MSVLLTVETGSLNLIDLSSVAIVHGCYRTLFFFR